MATRTLKVVILDDYQNAVTKLDCFSLLADHEVVVFRDTIHDIERLAARLADADVLVLIRERTPITRELLQKLPKLRFIAQTGKASAHIDLEAATEHKVAVSESRFSGMATAELVWGLILASMRRIPQYIAQFRNGVWQRSGLESEDGYSGHGLGTTLAGKTLAIWGYGRIARILGKYGQAFGMHVLIWGSEASREAAKLDGYDVATSKEDLFTRADVLTLQLRLVAATRNIVTLGDFQRMKPTALFVNTSRSGLIEDGALLAALRSGRPGFAALDVFEQEPPGAGYPLLHMQNVICTPHIGYVEKENYEALFDAAFRDVLAWHEGTPEHVINMDALDR